jgi:arylformamidase
MAEPRVFLDYTQAELDRAYDQRAWAPTMTEDLARHAAASAALRERLPHHAGVAYGPTADETLDVFPAAAANAPVHVLVHGGAWRRRLKDDMHFVAEPFVAAGAVFVALGFAVIPAVRLPDMAEQVRRAIAWICRNARSFGGDPGRLHLSGHSSGGHLAAVLLTTDWKRQAGVPADVLKSGLCVSGMYDLHPVLLSARSSYVDLHPDEIHALSPQRHLDRIRCPLTVACGERESPEFQRQARDFAAAVRATGRPVELIRVDGANHFEMLDLLGAKDGLLARVALAQMGLA